MAYLVALLLALAAFAAPAAAVDDDVMEVQRCIWRCLADSKGSSDPEYTACVAARCNDEPSSAEADRPGADGVWTYGTHPKLGLSAHVRMGEDAYGISCETPPGTGYAGALRMTTGLVLDATGPLITTSLYTGPFSISGNQSFEARPGGFVEALGDVCTVDVERLRKSKQLWLLREKMISLEAAAGDQTLMTLERDGKRIPILTEADLPHIVDPIVVPLAGSTAAINRLLRACPNLRRQVAEGCGSGD